MIELTNDQIQALQREGAQLPRVRNPQTQETFVLVPDDLYEQMHKFMGSYERVWDDPALDVYEQYRDKP